MPTLVRCAGPDGPGITAAVLAAVEAAGATLIEMDQLVVRGRLTLDLLVEAGAGGTALADGLAVVASERGLDVSLEPGPDAAAAPVAVGRVRS